MSKLAPKLIVSENDYARLSALVRSCQEASINFLEEELGRAQVVPAEEVPGDVITMHSKVRVRDLDSGGEEEYELVYPHEANLAAGKISVLAKLGAALIGLRAGDRYEWLNPQRRLKQFRVISALRA